MPTIDGKTAKELFAPDAPPATRTRDRLIDTALHLFQAHGFHAVGLDQVIAAVGVTKTTFYNHFESKDELMVAAIRRRDEWEMLDFTTRVREMTGDDPRRGLLAIFDLIDQWFTDPAFRGCLFINACAEFPNPHDPVHKAASHFYLAAEGSIRDLAKRAGAAEPETLAAQLTILMEGAMTRRQVSGDHEAARRAGAIAACLLREQLPGPEADGSRPAASGL